MLREENKLLDESRQGEAYTSEHQVVKAHTRKLYLESYGCAMNFSDSEIIASIMNNVGFETTKDIDSADVIFINTCAIRDNAERKIWARLRDIKKKKITNPGLVVGVMGCMAERLKTSLLEKEKLVDMVVGPDAYRDLPTLLAQVDTGQKAVNVLLSREETYADISPVRLGKNGVTAFISIMRGCDNMCSFCVVPFTRGRERSRDNLSIIQEARELSKAGYKEVTLLGQNVDSYKFKNEQNNEVVNFAALLEQVALVDPDMRIRFSTSHPKDITNQVVETMSRHKNICNYIHLPVQSGSSRMLELMNRTYNREWYKERVQAIRSIIPDCGISTDVIAGFCSETDVDHNETLSLLEWAGFDFAYMYKYSERPGTMAAKKYKDDVIEEIKSKRLSEIIEVQKQASLQSNLKDLNKTHRVLIEGNSKKSDKQFAGRNDQNKTIVFPKGNAQIGDYVNVFVNDCTAATLLGNIVENYLQNIFLKTISSENSGH